MANARSARRSTIPLNERIFSALPVSPAGAGILLGLGLIALFLGLVYASGEFGRFLAEEERWWQVREARLALLCVLCVAYFPGARLYHTAGTRRALGDLRRAGCIAGPSAADEAAVAAPHLRLAGSLGILIVPITGLLVDRDPSLYLLPEYWSMANLFVWGVGAFAGWNGSILLYTVVVDSRSFARLAREIPTIDLLALEKLAPFARQALRATLPSLVLLSFYSLNLVDRGFFLAIGAMGAFALIPVAAALWLPLRGLRQRIRAAKQQELVRVSAALRGETAALEGSCIASRATTTSLADLLAYRSFVEELPEWPFDAPLRLRLAVYVLLPVGSWLGGTLIDKVLEAALV